MYLFLRLLNRVHGLQKISQNTGWSARGWLKRRVECYAFETQKKIHDLDRLLNKIKVRYIILMLNVFVFTAFWTACMAAKFFSKIKVSIGIAGFLKRERNIRFETQKKIHDVDHLLPVVSATVCKKNARFFEILSIPPASEIIRKLKIYLEK